MKKKNDLSNQSFIKIVSDKKKKIVDQKVVEIPLRKGQRNKYSAFQTLPHEKLQSGK